MALSRIPGRRARDLFHHHHRMVSRLGSPRFDAGMVPRFLTILTGKPADNPAAAGA